MKTIAALDAWLTFIVETVMVILFAIFLVIVCAKVLLRPFDQSIFGVDELVKIAFLTTSALGGAVAISKREHIAITFFIEALPRTLTMAFYILGLVLIAVMNAALVYLSFDWLAGPGGNTWQPFGMQQAYVFVVVPIACGLAIFYCLAKIALTLSGAESIDRLWMPED
ncbi:MAG: TRAP transporter small permease subunit [Pseudomonadota bacterium]